MTQPYVLAFVGENANGILHWWTRQILAGFGRHGLHHRLIDLANEGWRTELGNVLVDGNPAFCFSFQGFGMDLRLNGSNFWSLNRIPFLSYMGDNPYHSPALHAAEGEGMYLLYGCVDFLETYQRYMGGRAYASTLRYGYPENTAADWLPWPDREHPVVFVKTGIDPARMRQGWDVLPSQTRTILNEASAVMLEGTDATVAATCADVFDDLQIHWGDRRELFLFACSSVDRYVRATRAERMVRALMPHDALIVGDWTHLDTSHARARFAAPVPATRLDSLYASSRIVANTSPSVRCGMHERIMAGLFARSAVLSDSTPFLRSTLSGCPSFLPVDIDRPDLPDQVADALRAASADRSMPDKLDASLAVARALFSFDDFIAALLDQVRLEDHRRTLGAWSFPPAELQA